MRQLPCFWCNVPEKIIQTTAGHESLDSLRMCECASIEQHQAVSQLMMSTTPTSYQEQPGTTTENAGKTHKVEVSRTRLVVMTYGGPDQLQHW